MLISDLLNPRSFRYERKFLLTAFTQHHVAVIVRNHPGRFSEPYPERFVNNIYFDTMDMSHFWDNVAGITPRIKVRIRWYGDFFGPVSKPVLEFKLKNNNLGSKVSFVLDPMTVDDRLSLETVRDSFRRLDMSETLKEYLMSLRFSLMNRYRRAYFASLDGRFRITIDSDLEFMHPVSPQHHFIRRAEREMATILELKYEEAFDNEAGAISNYFPFRMTKSSKYVSGVRQI